MKATPGPVHPVQVTPGPAQSVKVTPVPTQLVNGTAGLAQPVKGTAAPAQPVSAPSLHTTPVQDTACQQSSQRSDPPSTGTGSAGTSQAGTGSTSTGSTRAPLSSNVLLSPDVTSFMSGSSALNTVTLNTDKGKKTGRGKAQNKSNKPGDDFNADFAKYETNVLQAKLREQELTIKDLRFKNNLLESRVEDLEKKQKQDIYEKYFPKPDAPTDTRDTINNTEHTGCCSRMSQPVSSCCRTQYHPCHNQPMISCRATAAPDNAVMDIAKKIDELKKNIEDLKCKMDITIDVSIPQKIRDTFNQYIGGPSLSPETSSTKTPTTTNTAGPSLNKAQDNVEDKSGDAADPLPNPSNVSNTTIDDAMSDISFDLN